MVKAQRERERERELNHVQHFPNPIFDSSKLPRNLADVLFALTAVLGDNELKICPQLSQLILLNN